MHITSLRLQSFKRFTDLRLADIPADTRLVLLIGANGSGKSSIFDAFEYASRPYRGVGAPGEMSPDQRRAYFGKGGQEESIEFTFDDVSGDLRNGSVRRAEWQGLTDQASTRFIDRLQRLYGRSTLRVAARIGGASLRTGGLSELISKDQDAPATFIDTDSRLMADAMKFAVDFNAALREPVFEGRQVDLLALRNQLIEPINNALKRVFGPIGPYPEMVNFREPETPGAPVQYFFRKGEHTFAYDVLSFGEKQVFAVLLNLFVRRDKLTDSVIYIDELDLHLNTALQYALLEEIVEHWIPADSQLWTASHSLGFIRYAMQHPQAAIFDLDALDFDQPRILTPAPKDTSELLQVAVPAEYLPGLFAGKRLIYCEGQDAAKYNSVGLPDTIFAGGGNKFQVFGRARDGAMPGIVDRDYLSDDEIAQWELRLPQLRILRLYSIENYFYHPANLAEVHGDSFDRAAYMAALVQAKQAAYDGLNYGIAKARDGYPFARDLAKAERPAYEAQGKAVAEQLKSDDFERFYPVFPMKDCATQLPQRQNLSPVRLARTVWFAAQMQVLLASIPVIRSIAKT